MIKYLDLKRGVLADSEVVEKELDVILQKEAIAHQHSVKAGGAKFTRANHSDKVKERESRLRNNAFIASEKPRLERELELLKTELSNLEREVLETSERYQLALRELRDLERDFNGKYVGVIVLNLEEILKLNGGKI